MDTRNRCIETEMDELIGTYLERDLVSAAAKRRAKRLHSNGDRAAALRLLVDDHKRNRTGDGAS